MSEQQRHNLFTELVARHQNELYHYIFAIVRNWNDADDLLQSVCLVLWRKFDSFQPGTNFLFWATRTAKIEVSNFLRRKQSANCDCVNDDLLDVLSDTIIEVQAEGNEAYLEAMRRCKAKLSSADEELLELHYVEDLVSRQIAERLCRPQSSVCHSLARIRSWLFECIQMDLARQERGGT